MQLDGPGRSLQPGGGQASPNGWAPGAAGPSKSEFDMPTVSERSSRSGPASSSSLRLMMAVVGCGKSW